MISMIHLRREHDAPLKGGKACSARVAARLTHTLLGPDPESVRA